MISMPKILTRRGMAVMEYLFALGIVIGTFILISKPFYNVYQGYVADTAGHYFGDELEDTVTPFVSKGSRNLADQTVVYGLNGITSDEQNKLFQQTVNEDGSRSLGIQNYEIEFSPGEGSDEIGFMPEYTLDDLQDEPPEYVPPFVGSDEGWIQPAVRN